MLSNMKKPEIHKYRYENFGGIISCLEPPFLAWVDKDFMRNISNVESKIWKKKNSEYLSAPTEVHFAVTNKCSQKCEGCYMSSVEDDLNELSLNELKKIFKNLADMGVFHVALGGGEAFERADFAEIVSYCREIGLVPNLTTNGQNIGKKEIEICKKMGQINISIDGIGDNYSINGRKGDFDRLCSSIRLLKKNKINVGANCVVSSKNYDTIEDVISFAHKEGLSEIEFLKYKPSGRATQNYYKYALSMEMIKTFYPYLTGLRTKYNPELKIDCSFIPSMVYHKPNVEDLEKLGVSGCEGGNILLGAKSDGSFSACSFIENTENILDLQSIWDSSNHLNSFRTWTENCAEPCLSCKYLSICRGGCRASTLFLTGDFLRPDPECPIVFDFMEKQ